MAVALIAERTAGRQAQRASVAQSRWRREGSHPRPHRWGRARFRYAVKNGVQFKTYELFFVEVSI